MNAKIIYILAILLSSLVSQGQISIKSLKNIPNKVSNNAVASAVVDGNTYVYSFAGIDSTKLYSGIHKHAFRYDIENDTWTTLPDLPSGNGRIAASASNVNGLIYIIGGYEVFSDGSELSYRRVHVFDPVTNNYLADAKPIPIAIDDHAQIVYKDSLIYVISGWSNTGNVKDVQIYNPELNEWSKGTKLLNTSNYKVFGSNGSIIGDTIYYVGGASSGSSFPVSNALRKGYINPNDPTDITWSVVQNEYAKRYRPIVIVNEDKLYWLGGSETSYNYDAIAYNGSGIVSPSSSVIEYDNGNMKETSTDGPEIMDIRTIAQVSSNQYIIVGGMGINGEISDEVTLIDISNYSLLERYKNLNNFNVFPNPVENNLHFNKSNGLLKIHDLNGYLVLQKNILNATSIDVSNFGTGIYILSIIQRDNTFQRKFIKR